jgi:hypothetical protein
MFLGSETLNSAKENEMAITVDDPTKYLAPDADVRRRVKNATFEEGLNVVYTAEDRVTLAAEVRNGKVVDYVFVDAQGKKVPSTLVRKPAAKTRASGALGLTEVTPVQGEEICYRCRRLRGTLACVEIPCPK